MDKSEQIQELAAAMVTAQGEIWRVKWEFALANRLTFEWVDVFFNRVVADSNGCLLWQGALDDLGYGHVAYCKKNTRAHRLSWMLLHGWIAEGQVVRHSCDVRQCVNPQHLSLGTQADNVTDMMTRGRHVVIPMFGETNPASRITVEIARDIRASVSGGERRADVARRLGLRPAHVSRIVRRELWSHV